MSKITVTQIRDRINLVRQDKRLAVRYSIQDTSVQTELRLRAEWAIRYPADQIKYPKCLARDNNPLWAEMYDLERQIQDAALIKQGAHGGEGWRPTVIRISAATKSGPAKRQEARDAWELEAGQVFLADYLACAGDRYLARVRKQITALQAQQKALLPQLRAANSAYIQARTQAKQEQARKNTDALAAGRFWEADHEAIKSYFHPPFAKNHLADVSAKWRAVLFTECQSSAWKAGKGDWRHKLVGTGRAYLCGIDDNGDEWGHHCQIIKVSQFGDFTPDGTVDEAMSDLFGISVRELANCQRQGDLLFCQAAIPEGTELHQEEEWEIRESHRVESPALERNGRYFRSTVPIAVTHTSHAALTLEPGSYRLYAIRVANAD